MVKVEEPDDEPPALQLKDNPPKWTAELEFQKLKYCLICT